MTTDKLKGNITLSPDPNHAIQEMMDIIDALRSVMVEETESLKASDSQGFLALQEKKMKVAQTYQSGVSQILSRKEEMRSANATLRNQLETMRHEFADTTAENVAAIERMQKAMQRVGEKIMNAARESAKKQRQVIYGANGQIDTGRSATIGVRESA